MSVSKLVKEVETGLGETQNQRDVRVEELWKKLDPNRFGELDLKGLQQGFKKIDHREELDPLLLVPVSYTDTDLQL
jgi:solute carrier family 25 phosphate transporter 23/24/25/41